ncbi:WD40-repeat-containing domain protein [Pilobolus umbonatus]|nr:WD40-repeat-containing domain protein [Pilobolus umbonatus]
MEVHRCRFVEYQPAAINALDFTPVTVKETRVAVGRANGNIEIWDPSYKYRLEKTLPGGEGLSIESIVWAHQSVVTNPQDYEDKEELKADVKELLDQPPRLFSSGLNPYIIEWDTTTMTAKKSCDSNGGAVWCLAVNSTGIRLAAGCEDGCIRLFNIADGNLEYIRSFAPQNGRVLSVAWAPNDSYIASGGSDSAVRIWDSATGQSLQRMTVSKKRNEQTLVWAVAAVNKLGTLKQSFHAHGADILCLAASKDGKQVFSAGVDRKITAFRRSHLKKKNENDTGSQWINVGSRRYHWHDIRAIALDDRSHINSIISGGVDVELVACPAAEFPKLIQNRLPPFPHKYLASVSRSKKLVMASFFDSICLWKLGKSATADLISTKPAIPEMLQPHQLLLTLKLKPDCNITSSCLSEDANWIAVSDVENVRLFRVSEGDESGQLIVKKQRSFERELDEYLGEQGAANGAHHVRFTPDSQKLIIVTTESRILIVDLSNWENEEFEIMREFGHHRGFDSEGKNIENSTISTVVSIAVSSDGQWLGTADDKNNIHVFNLDSLKHHIQLPRENIPHTALSFNEFRPNELLVSLANNAFYIYDVEHKRLTDWSRKHIDMSNCRLLEQRDRIRGVIYNPAEQNKMILYGSTFMCLVDLEDKEDTQLGKRKPGEDKTDDSPNSILPVSMSFQYQQILHCDFLGENKMVMIERPKFSVLENLPPSFYKAHFGAA